MLKCSIQLLFALCISAIVYAGEIKSVGATLDGGKGELKAGAVSLAYDTAFFADQQSSVKKFIATDIKNIISFQLYEGSTHLLKAPFKAILTYRLKYKFKNTFNNIDSLSDNQVLEISYDTASNKPFNARKSIEFNDAVEVTLTIVSIQTDAQGWDPIPALRVRNDMMINRTFAFDCENNKVSQINFLAPTAQNADELKVYWDQSLGADEYDLEWTYMDESMYNSNAYGAPASAEFEKNSFRNRASRVTLNASTREYLIPLLYESKGYIFLRIRGVQLTSAGKRFETNWSAVNQFYFVPGHQPRLNWQAATSYAEEGKRKSVVQYFDGSLHNRQTVTKDNTTQTTVVAETKYDYQGRPVIQVLPSPTLNSIIEHTPNFNSFLNTGQVYNNYKDVYDQLRPGETICDVQTPGLDMAKGGAAQYYSPSNPEKNNGVNQFIPDSKGYPYTETQYMPDNTGRIKAQGGVGPDHKLNSGHDTKYYYSTPDQIELDALFGTEAGYASHYFKNMVRDANGQYSISYIDMHGRTIATALAGELPSSTKLDYLASKNDIYSQNKILTRTLTSPENNMIKGLVIESSKSLLVTQKGTNQFKYSLLPQSFGVEDCKDPGKNICYSCSYDLEITISDDCGNTQFPNRQPYTFKTTIGSVDIANCSNVENLFTKSFPLELEQGNYIINKKLTIRDEALRKYEGHFATNNICYDLDYFIKKQEQAFIESGGCKTRCETCEEQLGQSKAAFVSKFIADNNLDPNSNNSQIQASNIYDKLAEQCKEFCGTAEKLNYVDYIKQMMLKDVTPPHGQYADPDQAALSSLYNIFARISVLNPRMRYQNALGGVTERIYVIRNKQSVSAAVSELTKDEFIANFKPEWAEILLTSLHPEREQYKRLITNPLNDNSLNVGRNSFDWDRDFRETETYAEAVQKGYLNPTNNAKYSARFTGYADKADPFFKIQTREKAILEAYLDNVNEQVNNEVLSAWSASSIMGLCAEPPTNECYNLYKANPFPQNNDCTGGMDYAWKSFREMYLAKKDEIVKGVVNSGLTPIPSTYRSYFVTTKATISNATGITDFNTKDQADNALNNFYSGDGSGVYLSGNESGNALGNTCDDYTELWWSQLAPCTTTDLAEYKDAILSRMAEVCKKGTDKNHFTGASSIAPNATNEFKDFDEIIKYYIDLYHRDHPDKTPINPLNCNASLITFPAPYTQPQVVANKPIITKPEDCDCERINNLYAAFTAENKDADFSAYVKRTLQTDISNEDLNSLRELCGPNPTCKFLPKKIYLPPALQCGMENACAPCSTVAQAYNDFKLQYPDYLPVVEVNTYEQQKINRLFTHFMNQKLGFNKSVAEYLSFIDECKDVDQNIDCTNLEAIVEKYNRDVNPYRFESFAQSPSTTPSIIDDLNAIVSDGTLHWPQSIRETTGREWVYFQHMTRNIAGNKFCTQNGYSIEWSFKSLKKVLQPSDDVFYFQDNNLQFVLYRQEAGTPGLYLREITGIAPDNSGRVTLYSGLQLLHNDPDIIYKEWSTVKLTVTTTEFKIYFNGVLAKQIARTSAPLINESAFTFAFLDYQAAIDWVKMYDANGNIVVSEDYNNPATRSAINSSFLCPQPAANCQAPFVTYFNQQKGTSYTFGEIDALYQTTCGSSVNVCTDIEYNRDNLKTIVDDFYVNAKPGKVGHEWGYGAATSITNLAELAHNGIIYLPDAIRAEPRAWYNNYQLNFNRFCTQSGYTIAARFKFMQDERLGDMFFLGFRSFEATFFVGNINGVPGLYIYNPTLYAYDGAPKEVFAGYTLIDNNVNIYRDWMDFKVFVRPEKVILYLNGNKVWEHDRNPAITIGQHPNFTLGLWERHAAIDWIRIGDVNDNTKYFEDFNDPIHPASVDPSFNCSGNNNCEQSFTNYFNQKQNTNYTYNQIDLIYKAAGIKLDACKAMDASTLAQIQTDYLTKNRTPLVDFRGNYGRYPDYESIKDPLMLIRDGALKTPQRYQDSLSYGYTHILQVWPKCYWELKNLSSNATEARVKLSPVEGNHVVVFNGSSMNSYLKITPSAVGYIIWAHSVGFNGKQRNTSEFPIDTLQNGYFDWVILKHAYSNGKYQYYINNKLVLQYESDELPGNAAGTGVGYAGSSTQAIVSIDWIKYYGENNQLLHTEDFNSATMAQLPAEMIANCDPENCNADFVRYFNQQYASNLSAAQIEELYRSNGLVYAPCSTAPGTTTAYSCDKLTEYINEYKNKYLQPASGYVDLDMRTFAGNKTPDEGPKGVFDVKGKLIGNTVDGGITAVKQSYVEVWNSSPANKEVGTLSLLSSGKFRLTLKPGQTVPREGIIGQRYYQFDVHTKDTLDNFLTSLGSYIDFGDGTGVLFNDNINTGKTRIDRVDVMWHHYANKEMLGADYVPISRGNARHYYDHTNLISRYTVTVYHIDIKGAVGFSDIKGYSPTAIPQFSGLRGYFPQQLLELRFDGTRDSTINSVKQIKNFEQITTIQSIELDSYGNVGPFLKNNFGSFENNHDLRRLRLWPDLTAFSASEADRLAGNYFSENFPNLDVNFPQLRFVAFNAWGPRGADLANFKFKLPVVSLLAVDGQTYQPNWLIDSLYNQLASVSLIRGGLLGFSEAKVGINTPTEVSAAAKAKLANNGWYLRDGISNVWGPDPGPYDIISTDKLPMFSSFSDFINIKLGSDLSASEIDDLWIKTCGSKPDFTTTPPSIVYASDKKLCGNNIPTEILVEVLDDSPCADKDRFSTTTGYELYTTYLEKQKGEFRNNFINKCLEAAANESFTVTQVVSEYHYTLYYYDQAGNLVKTVPPKGVNPDFSADWKDRVKAAREAGQVLVPGHKMPTQYRYNTLNQVVQQHSPDAAYSNFWYDRLGRLAISQNAEQAAPSENQPQGVKYSYTTYDDLGRINQVGQIVNSSRTVTDAITRDKAQLNAWLNENSTNRQQITSTVYDLSPKESYLQKDLSPYITEKRGNFRNRVSFTLFSKSGNLNDYDFASFYNYDIHGNVNILLQDYGANSLMAQQGHRYKRLAYTYDLISGKVNTVSYQPRLYDPVTGLYTVQPDAFFHRYEYDAENRLINVYSSLTENATENEEDHDAFYQYYKHGPLARTVLGQNQVQGLDYIYTLQGWLKGVNSTATGNGNFDAGKDGVAGAANHLVARDAFGFSLQYYNGDYTPINNTNSLANITAAFGGNAKPLYNGNISSMAVNIPKLGDARVYAYTYDQLNRITAMDAWGGLNNASNAFTPVSLNGAYSERIKYDADGNILKYDRNGDKPGAQQAMDKLTYHYDYEQKAGQPTNMNTPPNNRLLWVNDDVTVDNYNEDIKNQQTGNYVYDKIGNLIKDGKEGITNITWTVYGKIETITKADATIKYGYDAAGNRISKAVTKGANTTTTIYVRDAQGNTMAVYEQGSASNSGHFTLAEQHIYGSSRLGIYNPGKDLTLPANAPINLGSNQSAAFAIFERNKKFFELTNHLGNVLATVSDEKIGVSADGNTIDYYTANIVSANDYYPFGMGMPGRKFSTEKYRYGFNGKENDKDIAEGAQDYGMRISDNRLGRFLSVDPLTRDYAFYSPYQYAGNKPTRFTDLDGLEENGNSTDAKIFVPIFSLPTKKTVLPVPRAYYFIADTRTEQQRREAIQQAEYTKTMNRMYNSPEGWSFRIFTGIGQAATVVIPEAAVAKGMGDAAIDGDVEKLLTAAATYGQISRVRILNNTYQSLNRNNEAHNAFIFEEYKADLRTQELSSIYKSEGFLKQEMVNSSTVAMRGTQLTNKETISYLTGDGSKISDWNKMSFVIKQQTKTGEKTYDLHYYYNSRTGTIKSDIDYKVKLKEDHFRQTPDKNELNKPSNP